MVQDAAPVVLGFQLAVVEQPVQDAAGQRNVVETALIEREQFGHLLLDDRNLDPRQRRQLAPLHRLHHGLQRRVAARGKRERPVARIGVEHHLRAALPVAQPERARADRFGHDVRAGRLDGFAGDGVRAEIREPLQYGVIDGGELQPQRVPIDRLQPFDRRVVVELAGLPCRVDDRPHAEQQVGERGVAAALEVGIQPALDRIDVVLGDELARLPFERGVGGEQDSGRDPDRPGAAAVGDVGHGRGGVGHHPRRRGEVVELVETFEYRVRHARGVQVRDLLRIEIGDVRQRESQHLPRRRRRPAAGVRASTSSRNAKRVRRKAIGRSFQALPRPPEQERIRAQRAPGEVARADADPAQGDLVTTPCPASPPNPPRAS